MRNEFSGMDFLGWIGARRGALGVVRGGRSRDVVDLLIETSIALPAIIGDRTSNEDILASRVLNGGPRPRMQVSRGLRHDLPAIVTASRDGPVLVVPRITDMYVRDERQRIAAQIRAVAGYDAPRAILDIVAEDRVAATFRDALRHLSAPLLIHDAVAQFPRMSLSGFSVFGYPVTETIDDDPVMDDEPSLAAIIDHA
ncbi:MAG: hypothetical protein K2Y05_11480, partial [Hyphomicrobiaceae bacterium]|nr:hypothetical protein [Hyphomicrobiaceae bacterium]